MAIVEELIMDADDEIRGATLRKATCRDKAEIVSHPLQKLFPLEI